MYSSTYNCHNCNTLNNINISTCVECEEPTITATLKSLGTGSAPKDFIWPLFPKDTKVGAGAVNDIVVPSNRVPLSVCSLLFKDDHYFVDARFPNKVFVRGKSVMPGDLQRLEHGDVLRMGLDKLKIQYTDDLSAHASLQTEKEKKQIKE